MMNADLSPKVRATLHGVDRRKVGQIQVPAGSRDLTT